MFASRLGSLSTVFTWLRSRACAGMQGLGVLALVVVAPCGFAAHVAPEEAVLSSLAIVADDASCEICSVPGARAPIPPQNQSPWTPPPGPLHPSHPTGYPSKKSFFTSFYTRLNTTHVAKFAPSLGPVPLPPTPLEPKPLDHPSRPPPPHRVSFKKNHFSSFCTRQQVAKFAPSLGPVPLPPTPPAPKPLDPPSRALVPPPHPTGYPKKIMFAPSLKRAPTTYPPPEALGPPPEPQPRGLLFSVWTQPFPLLWNCLPPCPPGQLRWVTPPPHRAFCMR